MIIEESAAIIMESPQLELASLEHFPMQISLNDAFLTLIIFDGKANKLNTASKAGVSASGNFCVYLSCSM